jgi:rod shape-determining protein MreD
MKPFLFIPLLAVLALFQSTILPYISILGVRPNLILLAVVSWTLLRGLTEGLTWAFVGGLWFDLLSGGPFGLSALTLVFVAFLASLLEASLFREHIVLLILIIGAATVVHGALYLIFLRIANHPASTWAALWRIVIPAALYTSLLTPAVFPLVLWLHRITWREQLEW